MAKTNTTTGTAADEIAVLREQLASLRQQQADVTEEAKYDQLEAEISTIEKAISLAGARRRLAELEATRQAREQALGLYEAGVKQLEELRKEGERLDRMLFVSLREFYRIFREAWMDAEKAAQLSDVLKVQARELGIEPLSPRPITIANILMTAGPHKGALQILEQYASAWGFLSDARKRGLDVPEEPGLDWYAKGQGQFWPRQTGGE